MLARPIRAQGKQANNAPAWKQPSLLVFLRVCRVLDGPQHRKRWASGTDCEGSIEGPPRNRLHDWPDARPVPLICTLLNAVEQDVWPAQGRYLAIWDGGR